MKHRANQIFISYRRDDGVGYAGRLEEALEKRLGRGSVFRDVLDISPGEDFVAAIRARLAGARAVLVLIGPRWAGGEAPDQRRIDDAGDFVRLEVAVALESGARVVPVLLPGATMLAAADLPEPLKPLAQRNALSLNDVHWQADVKYGWGDKHVERFEFKRHAGQPGPVHTTARGRVVDQKGRRQGVNRSRVGHPARICNAACGLSGHNPSGRPAKTGPSSLRHLPAHQCGRRAAPKGARFGGPSRPLAVV